jgi:hypothetical protein
LGIRFAQGPFILIQEHCSAVFLQDETGGSGLGRSLISEIRYLIWAGNSEMLFTECVSDKIKSMERMREKVSQSNPCFPSFQRGGALSFDRV